jgi:LytR cell envelope-related transcriptional attenuator
VPASDQRGVAVSSPLALLSAAAVVLAGVAFVATNGPRAQEPARASATVTVTPSPSTAARKPAVEKKHPKPVVHRGETYVEVFNNSGISGLAGSTAARASGAGWQVIGSDNWYGTIDASTVYYPLRLHAAAKLLAKDLGIARIKPTIAPMRGDRLTVILTSDYS